MSLVSTCHGYDALDMKTIPNSLDEVELTLLE